MDVRCGRQVSLELRQLIALICDQVLDGANLESLLSEGIHSIKWGDVSDMWFA
ncbi:hypothetical protein AEAC466_16945 [Asticcacaulis sp. AC466]|nr:hypothetical protein AEAC466_16945 [Asticcacaulis sp. AC466]